MKFRKTPQDQRSTYAYPPIIIGGQVKQVILRAGEDGVTELDIQMLHQADDREVYNNIKNARPSKTEEEKAQLKDWEEKQDWRMFDKNWTISIDAYSESEAEGDRNPIWKEIFNAVANKEVPNEKAERLHEVIEILKPEQQDLIQKIFFEGINQNEIAAQEDVTPQAIQGRLNRIYKQIEKFF